jgi:hypothetical protein
MQKISDDELKLGAIWTALGMARDRFEAARRRKEYPDLMNYYRTQADLMQLARDGIEEQMERLKSLEELDGRASCRNS